MVKKTISLPSHETYNITVSDADGNGLPDYVGASDYDTMSIAFNPASSNPTYKDYTICEDTAAFYCAQFANQGCHLGQVREKNGAKTKSFLCALPSDANTGLKFSFGSE